MGRTAAALRDEGHMPAEAALVFTEILRRLALMCGKERALELCRDFLEASIVATGSES